MLNAIADVCEPDPKSGIVLTDNFNPSEFYDASNREEVRRGLARAEMKRRSSAFARR